MRAIENLFLRAKHWQLFVLFVSLPTITEIVGIVAIPAGPVSWHDLGVGAFMLLILTEVWFLSFLAWLGSIGFFSRSIEQPELRTGTQFFRFALVYPAIYMVGFIPFLLSGELHYGAVILPLHFLCMICLFYDLVYVSKALALAENGKPVSFYEYAGPFFLLWFFPIGVWFVQPRINRLYAEREDAGSVAERKPQKPQV